MMQCENAVVDDKPCQHDDAYEIDEIELETADGGETEAPQDSGGSRHEHEKEPQRRTNDWNEAKQKDGDDDDDDSAYLRADVLRYSELECVSG